MPCCRPFRMMFQYQTARIIARCTSFILKGTERMRASSVTLLTEPGLRPAPGGLGSPLCRRYVRIITKSIWLGYGISNRASPRLSARGGRPTGSIRIEAGQHGMRLTYRYRQRNGAWREVQEVVPFVETVTCFGGRRRWFECPGCVRPCRVLYGGGRFLCRLCLRLRYASQYETAGGRARVRAQKLRMRLGGSANLLMPFPFRPKHMQRRTYRRLIDLDAHLLSRITAELARPSRRP